MKHLLCLLLLLSSLWSMLAQAEGFEYDAIQTRYADVLTSEKERYFTAQGECMAGIKKVNFAGGEYDPVAEWLRVRTTHLLYEHEPCDVLLILEVAEKHIRAEEKLNVKDYVEEN